MSLNLLEIFTHTVWLMLPAYITNLSPVLIAKFTGEGKPMDFGKSINNKRILGQSKTFRGFFGGIAVGIIIGIIELTFSKSINLPEISYIAIVTLPAGTLTGDLVGSFIKRRLNIPPGGSVPILDQLDFVFGAWVLTLIFDYKWFITNFSLSIIICTLVLTTIFHFVFNVVGYKIGVSKHPW